MPDGWPDDHAAARLLDAEYCVWTDASVDWERYDRVVVRSVWDYPSRVEEFLTWCRSVGPGRLCNSPELVAFNADKRYLAEMSAPTVPTTVVAPGDPLPSLDGEIVVKPSVSAGARDTGRFGPATHGLAATLIERIAASGRAALVQRYMPAVDEHGETAIVFLGGELSHVVRKRALLRPDEIAPVAGASRLGVAEAMLEDDLVRPSRADAVEQALARRVLGEIAARFGMPAFARVDLVPGPDGGPLLLELEGIEPILYLATSSGASERFAAALRAR